jgi:hypothetical protein
MKFNIFNVLKDKDKNPKKMQPKQGFVSPPDMPKSAVPIAKLKNLNKNPGK